MIQMESAFAPLLGGGHAVIVQGYRYLYLYVDSRTSPRFPPAPVALRSSLTHNNVKPAVHIMSAMLVPIIAHMPA